MPYTNFNVARVRNPNDFKEDSFRTIKGGTHMFDKAGLVEVPEEIRVISGQLKEVENGEDRAPMELLFPIDSYPEESDVRTWLDDENIDMIDYFPAGEGEIDDEGKEDEEDTNEEDTNEEDRINNDDNIESVTIKKNKKENNNFKNKNMERRLFANEFRIVDDKKTKSKKIIGYASVFNADSQDLGGFIERINPNAFDKVIEDEQDVRALFNHNADLGVLGRTTSGTLRLSVDETGLKYEIDTPDTQLARDLMASMERGDISQSSFGFTISENGDSWDEDAEGRAIRTINQVEQLFDISPVVYPAYTDASVALRSFDNYKENKQKTTKTKKQTDLHERNLRELKLKLIK